MGLETATFITGLNTAWPPSGDPKAQGDDHIRLLKNVLNATFPTASRAFYFPTATSGTANVTLVAADQNRLVQLDTTAGSLTATLPALSAGDAGWECEIIKISSDANAITVSPASGNISSKVGSTATIRVGQLFEPARFKWTGTLWICVKPGELIGTTINLDGPTVPPGYLTADGSTFSATTFAELANALGGVTLRDKRGRVEAGVDGTAGRLTATAFGTTAVNGAVGGGEAATLVAAQIPNLGVNVNTSGTLTGATNSTNLSGTNTTTGGGGFLCGGPIGSISIGVSVSGSMSGSGNTNNTGGGAPVHPNVQPTIVVQKLVRAC